MHVKVLILFLCLCVFETPLVESGIILDGLKSGISNTGKGISCGVHKFGGLFTQGKIVSCKEQKSNTVKSHGENTDDKVTTFKPIEAEVSQPVETVTKGKGEGEIVTVPGGRRVISVGANCPPGYRGDGKGNCREEY